MNTTKPAQHWTVGVDPLESFHEEFPTREAAMARSIELFRHMMFEEWRDGQIVRVYVMEYPADDPERGEEIASASFRVTQGARHTPRRINTISEVIHDNLK